VCGGDRTHILCFSALAPKWTRGRIPSNHKISQKYGPALSRAWSPHFNPENRLPIGGGYVESFFRVGILRRIGDMQERFLHTDELDESLIPLCLPQSRMHAEEKKSSMRYG
jgi:hypothetical protein